MNSKHSRNSLLLIVLSFLLLFPAACSGFGFLNPLNPQTDSSRTVTDQAGRQVTIEGSVERIVSGYYISTSVCIAIGAADNLVGIEARADSRPIYALAKPELLELPSVGSVRDFNTEACLDLDPDLVILPYRLREAADIITEMGVPVILVNPESYPEIVEMILLIGRVTGKTDFAERLVAWIEDSRNEIDRLAAGIPEKPLVYMCGVNSWLFTAPKDMYQAAMIKMAGGRNATDDIEGSGWTEISYEHLLVIDPEVMIIPSEAGYGRDDIFSDPMLTQLSAVKTGRIYQMPSTHEAWDSPVPASMLGVKWLLSVLYENIYSNEDLKQATEDYYTEFFEILMAR